MLLPAAFPIAAHGAARENLAPEGDVDSECAFRTEDAARRGDVANTRP
jgi:hypothetical protein